MDSTTKAPATTRLMAEALTAEDQAKAVKEQGEEWMDCVEYTLKAFPDTDAGLKDAVKWCVAHDVHEEGRVYRESLRLDWRLCKQQYWYDDTDEVYPVCEGRWL